MKSIFTIFILLLFSPLFAQTKISQQDVFNAEKLIDIELTDTERDSLINLAQNFLMTYKVMHAQKLENAVAPALYFNPSVKALDFSKKSLKPTVWDIPTNTVMPKNKADLAYYSLPQLASLIKNKKTKK